MKWNKLSGVRLIESAMGISKEKKNAHLIERNPKSFMTQLGISLGPEQH